MEGGLTRAWSGGGGVGMVGWTIAGRVVGWLGNVCEAGSIVQCFSIADSKLVQVGFSKWEEMGNGVIECASYTAHFAVRFDC